MSAQDAGEGDFKVTDRRHRLDEEDRPSTPPPAREPPRAAGPRPEAPPTPDAPDRSLAGLFVMLASSAAIALGDSADPLTGEVHRDFGQAAELIDLLLLLREKTEGHRTAEETQVLDEVVYDLQLRYVAATRQPGR
jgi:hypothetical protein